MVGRQLAPGPGALGGPVWAQGRSLTRRPLRSRHGGRGAGSAHVLGPRWAGRAAVSVGQGETGAPRRSPARRLCPAGAPSLACEVSRSAVLAGGSLSAAPSWFRVTLLRLRTRGPSGLAILLPVNKAGGEPAVGQARCRRGASFAPALRSRSPLCCPFPIRERRPQRPTAATSSFDVVWPFLRVPCGALAPAPQRPGRSAAQPVPGAGPRSARARRSHSPWQPLPLDRRLGLGQSTRAAGLFPTHWLSGCLQPSVRALSSGLIPAAGTQSPCSVPAKVLRIFKF